MRQTVTAFLVVLFTLSIFSYTYAQDKSTIENLVEKYKSGVKLNENEFNLIKNIVDPVKSVKYQNPPSAPKGALSEGFEGSTFPPDGWTTINNDGGSKEWGRSTNDHHTGSACAAVSYETPNDDWLITPRLTVSSGDSFSFWAKSRSSSYLEDFNVKVSKTGTNVSDFTITLQSVTSTPASWTQYTYDLTGGGYGINDGDNIYIAIQCVSNDEWELRIDDVAGPNIYTSSTQPGDPSNPSPTDGATGVAYASGTLTWDFGANTDTYDLWFGPSGNMSKVVTDGAASKGGSYSYSNLNSGADYQWQVIAKNSTTGETTNGAVWSFRTALAAGQYQIGSGTNTGEHLPIEPYFGYTYSQSLYFSSDFGSVGSNKRISKIYYNYHKVSTNDHDADDWVVYIGTTTATSVSDWTAVGSLTKVFDGNSGYGDIAAGDGWMEITLDTPFNYDPSTDGNLIVAVDENSSGFTSGSDEFYCDQNTTKANVSIVYYNDDTNPDPASPPSGTTSSYYPNIRFQFEDIPAGPQLSVNPESKDYGTVYLGESSSEQTFTVTNNGQGTLQITATTITGTNSGDFVLTDNNTYPVNLTNGQTMTVQVHFSPSAEGARSATLRFTANAKTDHDVALSGTGHNATVSSYPYNEPFTSFTEASNATGFTDDWTTDPANTTSAFRWNPDKDGTPSSSTGPSVDHTSGDANGIYLFTEASSGSENDVAYVYTPPFDLSSLTNPAVKFYYHMYGADMGTLELQISDDGGSTWTTLVTLSGQQQESSSSPWASSYNELSAYAGKTVKFRFKAIKGSGYTGDMAIDDFYVGEQINKSFNSVTVAQAATSNILVGSTNNEILKLKFDVEGGSGTLPLNSITITGANKNDADIASNGVKLYRTATPTFATDNLVATGSFAKGSVAFNGLNYDLPSGYTYFWVTYDITSAATVGDTVDAKILANGIDVNGTTYNSSDDNPAGSRTLYGIALSSVTVTQASTSSISVGSSGNEILKIKLDVSESTTSGGPSVDFTSLTVTGANTDDNDVSAIKIYKTSNYSFNTDNLVATGTFAKGQLTFNLSESLTSDMYYWVAYDVSSSATDGNTVDALIPANGMTISGNTYNSADDNPEGSRTIHNYYHGGNGTLYGGYYFANSTPSGGSNRPTFSWIDTVGQTRITEWTSGSADDGYKKVPISFTFNFFGNNYDSLYIGSNGVIAFGTGYSGTGSSASIPSTNTPNNMIAVSLMDLDDRADGKIFYGTNGGNFVVTWYHYYDYGNDNEWITCQALLKPNGNIKLQYNYSESQVGDEISGDALIGIENSDGSDGHQYRNNGDGGPIFDNSKAGDLAVEYSKTEGATPVELSSFTAVSNGDGYVSIKWTTQTEVNTAMFELQRAEKPENNNEPEWKTIASVAAAGNSNAPRNYAFKDELEHSGHYEYRLKIVDLDGTFKYGKQVEIFSKILFKYKLLQNYPNPFNPSTKINFELKKESNVTLKIYDILGEEVATLVNGRKKAGRYTVKFNASNLASGIYFYRLNAGTFTAIKKMILMK